jgi:hypothetical protein
VGQPIGIFAIRELRITSLHELKLQDLLVLLKVAAHPGQRWTYAALARR